MPRSLPSALCVPSRNATCSVKMSLVPPRAAKLDGRQGSGVMLVVHVHVVDVDDSLVGYDVMKSCSEKCFSRLIPTLQQFFSADAEVEFAPDCRPACRPDEPSRLDFGISPSREHVGRRRFIGSLDAELAVYDFLVAYNLPFLDFPSNFCCSRTAPSRSKWLSHILRQPASHCSTRANDPGSTWQVRTRPAFCVRITPHSSST